MLLGLQQMPIGPSNLQKLIIAIENYNILYCQNQYGYDILFIDTNYG